MRRLILALLVVLWAVPAGAACSGASPNWTSTADYASVAACVAGATPGDTINVTAGDGTETWTGNTLTLTRGVHLKGPGRAALTISSTDQMLQISPDATAITNNETFRVTGFTFDGTNAHPLAYIKAQTPSTSTVFQNLAIGDNTFKDSGSGSQACVRVSGQVRGAIYGNIFDRIDWPLAVYGYDDLASEWTALGPSRAYGTIDNLFFEGNTIQYSSSFSGIYNIWTETGQGGRLVIRYNSFNQTNTTAHEIHDVHGMQNWGAPNNQNTTGTLITEYYGNTYTTNSSLYWWMIVRGGWALVHNNVLTGRAASGARIFMANYYGCDHLTKHPGQIANLYAWNNTADGEETGVEGPAEMDYCVLYHGGIKPLVENDATRSDSVSAFYSLNPSFDGTTEHGIGRGTTTPAMSCTNYPHNDANGQAIDGDAYWVASTATATVTPSVVQAGKLYKCVAGTWTQYYTPYTYPHPLSGAPAAPTNVRIR